MYHLSCEVLDNYDATNRVTRLAPSVSEPGSPE